MNREHPSTAWLMRRLDDELPSSERAALDAHLAGCAECRDRMRGLESLSGAIDDYYSAGLQASQPEGQRHRLAAALKGRTAPVHPMWYTALAVAASVILVAGIAWLTGRPPEVPAASPRTVADTFIALPYSDDSLSGEGAVVLQVEVPRSAIALAGIPVSDGPADGRVKAEVLVGADGLARGIRFLN